MKAAADSKQRELCRRLAEYNAVHPDNNFLDEMHARGNGSGLRFTALQAEAIEDALLNWKRRVNGAVYDPDRCPPGYSQEIWDLAGQFRETAEKHGLPCTGRKILYQELTRAIRRDNIDTDYAPWRDKDGKPGWVRMLSKVIDLFIEENSGTHHPFGLHYDLAQPGVIRSFNQWMIEQAKLDLLLELREEDKLNAASTPDPTQDRRAAVRLYIASRESKITS